MGAILDDSLAFPIDDVKGLFKVFPISGYTIKHEYKRIKRIRCHVELMYTQPNKLSEHGAGPA